MRKCENGFNVQACDHLIIIWYWSLLVVHWQRVNLLHPIMLLVSERLRPISDDELFMSRVNKLDRSKTHAVKKVFSAVTMDQSRSIFDWTVLHILVFFFFCFQFATRQMQKDGSTIKKLQNRLLYCNLCNRSVGKQIAHCTKYQRGYKVKISRLKLGRKMSERTAKPF